MEEATTTYQQTQYVQPIANPHQQIFEGLMLFLISFTIVVFYFKRI